jgi:hypothetical protein
MLILLMGQDATLNPIASLGLQQRSDDDARCKHCGAIAVGPCARCHDPVCGDCCVLTEHGATTWAICLACDGHGGRSLRSAWASVALWIAGPIVALLVLVILLELIFG